MPRIVINFIFYVPGIVDSPLKAVYIDILIELLHEKILIEIGHQALLADLEYSIKVF